jgi:hypothetical protein
VSGTDAAARLTRDTAALAREQIGQLVKELTATVREAGAGAALLGGAGVCGVLALAAAHQSALRTLETMMPRPLAAVTLTGVYGGAAAALTTAGLKKIRAAADASGAALSEAHQADVPDGVSGSGVSGSGVSRLADGSDR